MDDKWIKEMVIDYEQDIEDAKKNMEQAEKELKDAQDWLQNQRRHYADYIIKLHEFKKQYIK